MCAVMAAHGCGSAEDGRASLALLEALAELPRFSMLKMFLSDADRRTIGGLFDAIEARVGEGGPGSGATARARAKFL
jgi:hypothetical protein